MKLTFKQYLTEEVERKFFNPERFRKPAERVLDMIIKASDDSNNPMNDLVLLEAISIVKEVLMDRLAPYEDPNFKEYKKDDNYEQLITNLEELIKDTLNTNFRDMKNVMSTFVTTFVGPILEEVQKVGPGTVYKGLDKERFDATARDVFGYLMRYIERSVIIPNAEDADVAKRVLMKWGKEVRQRRKAGKRVTRNQRQSTMKTAVEDKE